MWMSREDYWWLSYIRTENNIACWKNGWEGPLPDVTRGSEFNTDKNLKKVLDTETEMTNKKELYGYVMDGGDSTQLHM